MTFTLSAYTDQVSTLCARHGVERLALFGSAVRNDFEPNKSDLDFLVDFAATHPLGLFERYFGLKEDLEKLLGHKVDLVEAGAIQNPYFREAVEEVQVLVYET